MQNAVSSLTPEARPAREALRRWFTTPVGEYVLKTEVAVMDQLLPGLFGYNLVQLSVQDSPLFGASTVQTKIPLALDTGFINSAEKHPAAVNERPILARPAALPLESDSIDVAIIHHFLDFADSPQEILKELARVTLPMGHMVIIGFNPRSFWGVWRSALQFKNRPPWNGQYISPGRLMDWLNLLDFKIDRAQYAIYRPPIPKLTGEVSDYSKGLSRNINLPVGGIYVIVARKHIGAVRSIRPVWKSRQAFDRLSVVPSVKHDGLASVKHPPKN